MNEKLDTPEGYKSVTLLASEHSNLNEYLKQLERERHVFAVELGVARHLAETYRNWFLEASGYSKNIAPLPTQENFVRFDGKCYTRSDIEFARKLERERDKMRQELDEWRNAAVHVEANHPDEVHCSCVPVLKGMVAEARRERNEARRMAEYQRDMRVGVVHASKLDMPWEGKP